MQRVFVTGGTGLLGSHVVRSLLDRGAEVVALVRDNVPQSLFYQWGLDKRVVTVRGELEDYALIERALNEHEIDSVFHLGAQTIVGTANASPLATFRANIEGTWNVLEACRVHKTRIKCIAVASSDKAYGNLKGEAYDESYPLQGEHPYDVSKSCADLIARSYFVTYGLPVVITRCGNFFGPGDLNFSRLIPGTIRDVVAGKAPVIRSDGTFVRDYIFVEDGAHAYLTLADALLKDASLAGEAFNFSYGLRLTVLDVVNKVLAVIGSSLQPQILNAAKHEIPSQHLDSSKARARLHWSPRFGFDEGLTRTITWYTQQLGSAQKSSVK